MLHDKLRYYDDVKRSAGMIQRLATNQEELIQKFDRLSSQIGKVKQSGGKSVKEMIEDALSEVRKELDGIHRTVSKAADTHKELSNAVADYCVYFENEIKILYEQSRCVKRRDIEINDVEGALAGVDWERVLMQVKQENKLFENDVNKLVAEIERKGQKATARSLTSKQGSQNHIRINPDLKEEIKVVQQVPRILEIPDIFKENPHFATGATKDSKPAATERRPSQRRASLLSNGEEYFELELTENSHLVMPGLVKKAPPRETAEPEPVRKLIFEEDHPGELSNFELKSANNKNTYIPPRSNLRARKNNSQESSFLNRNYSVNNSGVNESSASRRKKRESNVVIRLRSNSQQNESRSERANITQSPISDHRPSDKKTVNTISTCREPLRQLMPTTNLVKQRASIFEALLVKKTGITSRGTCEHDHHKSNTNNTYKGGMPASDDRYSITAPLSHRIEIGIDRSIKTSNTRGK